MATTTNFGWETPDDTDLVKDGALAMRTLGNSIDTSFVDLKGGTTGQILSKASNTDLDYTWINNDQGDITGVTAGTGLTGGGTTGAVTVSLDSPVAATLGGTAQTSYATGDLLYASGTNTLAKRTIGTSGQVLTVSGGVPTWASPAGGGKVLQVLQQVYTTQTSSSSSTYADTGITLDITPSSTSSKILVTVAINGLYKTNGNTGNSLAFRLVRGSTTITDVEDIGYTGSTLALYPGSCSIVYLDSPSTTSATTYKVQFRNPVGAAQITINASASDSTITLMEIGA